MLLVVVLTAAGCNGTSQERLEGLGRFLGIARSQSQKADADVAALRKAFIDLEAMASDPDLSGETQADIKDVFAMLTEKLAVAETIKAKADIALAETEAMISEIVARGNANIGDELEAAGRTTGAVSSALPPPFNVWGGLVALGLTTVAAIVKARINSGQRDGKDAELQLQAHKNKIQTDSDTTEIARLEHAIGGIVKGVESLRVEDSLGKKRLPAELRNALDGPTDENDKSVIDAARMLVRT